MTIALPLSAFPFFKHLSCIWQGVSVSRSTSGAQNWTSQVPGSSSRSWLKYRLTWITIVPSHKFERTKRKYSQELRFGWWCYFNGLLSMSTSTRYKNWHPPVLMLMSVMVNMAKPVEDPQIKIRVLTIYTIHLGGNFRCKYSVLQLVETQIGKIRRCTSINWKGQKEKKKCIELADSPKFLKCFKWNGMYHFIFQPEFPGFPCKW